jgi:hypothetical protein
MIMHVWTDFGNMTGFFSLLLPDGLSNPEYVHVDKSRMLTIIDVTRVSNAKTTGISSNILLCTGS